MITRSPLAGGAMQSAGLLLAPPAIDVCEQTLVSTAFAGRKPLRITTSSVESFGKLLPVGKGSVLVIRFPGGLGAGAAGGAVSTPD